MKKINIVAHRGFSSIELDNSKEAIIEGLNSNYTSGVEIDVQLTKDDVVIINHDTTLEFITNNYYEEIRELTYEELKDIDIGCNIFELSQKFRNSYKFNNGKKYRERLKFLITAKKKIIKLEDVIDKFKHKLLIIEAKKGEFDNYVDILHELLEKYSVYNFCVKSFDHKLIRNLKIRNVNYKLGYIVKDQKQFNNLDEESDFISINHELLDDDNNVKYLLNLNKDIMVYTINYKETLLKTLEKLKDIKKDLYIITDFPDYIYEYVNQL